MEYKAQYECYVQMVEDTLERLLPQTEREYDEQGEQIPAGLCTSMRYSLTAGGKRVRPVLLLAACRMLGADASKGCVYAAALEMIHTYSLIHDDLPGMDDDDYRRGRLTNHKMFGVGPAILAGDGLLNYAYECMLACALESGEEMERQLRAAAEIAQRAGVRGMIAGQSIDLQSEHMQPEAERLLYIHMHKTADLLTAPLLAAGWIAGASKAEMEALEQFGGCVGLAFQIDDDLLDITGDAAQLGKQTGMDAQRGKMTWPALVGVSEARRRSGELWDEAEKSLDAFGERAWFLKEFAGRLRERKK